MIKNRIIQLFILSLCVLAGCYEKESNSADLGNNVSEIEQPLENPSKNDVSDSKDLITSEQIIPNGVVTVIDPRTLEVVRSFQSKELGYEENFELYKSEIVRMAKELARGTDTFSGYDQSMVLDRIGDDGQIIKGNPGVILKESELVDKIMAASKNGDNVYLPLYIIESNYKPEDIPTLNDVVVASFTTYFKVSETGRNKNIELSAKALENIVVGDGDYFSFNTIVGERTEARGYQPAPEIINKKMVMGIGGGICQTSSTLFNAVDQIDVTLTERHHHSLNVGYVPVGRDATVSYDSLDFKFKNSSGAPFLIRTFYSEGMLTIEIRTSQQYKDILKKL